MHVKLKAQRSVMTEIIEAKRTAQAQDREIERIELTRNEVMILSRELEKFLWGKALATKTAYDASSFRPVDMYLFGIDLVYEPEEDDDL